MTTLPEILCRVSIYLWDSAHLIWPDATLTESVLQALEEYNLSVPLTVENSTLLEESGPEVSLASLPGFREILGLIYPWQPELASDRQQPNQVQGWHTWFSSSEPIVTVRSSARLISGQHLRVIYLSSHSIAGLDGASTTTIPAEYIGLLVRGAAGFAALSRAVDKIEIRSYGSRRTEPDMLARWGNAQVAEFRQGLSLLRNSLPPFPTPRWQMDAWERS
jgi:hypothetical protein